MHTIIIIKLPEWRKLLEMKVHIYMYYNHFDDVVTNLMIITIGRSSLISIRYSFCLLIRQFSMSSPVNMSVIVFYYSEMCSITRPFEKDHTLTVVGVYNCSACSFDLYVLKRVHLSVVENLHIRNIFF